MSYKGELEGFPTEVVEWMLEQQVKQGNERDITVFEKHKRSNNYDNGFDWREVDDFNDEEEALEFCEEVISDKNFDLFFQKYSGKGMINEYPKVMLVSDDPIDIYNEDRRRVVFMEKNGYFLAWSGAKTIEEAKKRTSVIPWKYAIDTTKEEIVELTLQDISDGKGVGIPAHLIRIKK
jgi:hypothetical protein